MPIGYSTYPVPGGRKIKIPRLVVFAGQFAVATILAHYFGPAVVSQTENAVGMTLANPLEFALAATFTVIVIGITISYLQLTYVENQLKELREMLESEAPMETDGGTDEGADMTNSETGAVVLNEELDAAVTIGRVGGALAGGALGAVFGPVGAAGGAVVGLNLGEEYARRVFKDPDISDDVSGLGPDIS